LVLIKQKEGSRGLDENKSIYAPVYRLKALTLNNMGCTLMKENRPGEALEYLN